MYVLFEIFSYDVDVVVDYYYVYVIVCGIIVTGAGVLVYYYVLYCYKFYTNC